MVVEELKHDPEACVFNHCTQCLSRHILWTPAKQGLPAFFTRKLFFQVASHRTRGPCHMYYEMLDQRNLKFPSLPRFYSRNRKRSRATFSPLPEQSLACNPDHKPTLTPASEGPGRGERCPGGEEGGKEGKGNTWGGGQEKGVGSKRLLTLAGNLRSSITD